MNTELAELITILKDARARLRTLIADCALYGHQDYDYREAVWTAVDLGHAEHDIDRAIGFIDKFFINNRKPENWPIKENA